MRSAIPQRILPEFFDQEITSLKQRIQQAIPVLMTISGKTYYVSPNGNDEQSGTSESTAWKSLAKVNQADLQPGDAVLFERGGIWRTPIRIWENPENENHKTLFSCLKTKPGVTYSSYGAGEKPLLLGSAINSADETLWVPTQYDHVYRYTLPVANAGIVVCTDFEGRVHTAARCYHETEIRSVSDMKQDLEFLYVYGSPHRTNYTGGTLYLYSENGNPGARFTDIEIGEQRNILGLESGVTVDGLCFRYTGAHAVGGNRCDHLTIRNCEISYIGGSFMSDRHTTYGNAIEIYGECDGFSVTNNYISQIWDTGITFQNGSNNTGDCAYRNILIRDNLIEYCHWSIEFYNHPRQGTERTTANVDIANNICFKAGMGWEADVRKESNGFDLTNTASNLICCWGMDCCVENFCIHDNLFFLCAGQALRLSYPQTFDVYAPGDSKIRLYANRYALQPNGGLLRYHAQTYLYSDDAAELLRATVGEETPQFYYVEES